MLKINKSMMITVAYVSGIRVVIAFNVQKYMASLPYPKCAVGRGAKIHRIYYLLSERYFKFSLFHFNN